MQEPMSAMLHDMRREIREIHAMVKSLCLVVDADARRQTPPKNSDQLVGAEYVAQLFDCSVRSVREGKAGTQHVRWLKRRPMKCTKEEAHAALARFDESRAPRRVPSLVRRKPQA